MDLCGEAIQGLVCAYGEVVADIPAASQLVFRYRAAQRAVRQLEQWRYAPLYMASRVPASRKYSVLDGRI